MSQIEQRDRIIAPQSITDGKWLLEEKNGGFLLKNPGNDGVLRFYVIKVDPQNPGPIILEVPKNGPIGGMVGTVVLTTALGGYGNIEVLFEREIPVGLDHCQPTRRATRASVTNPNQPAKLSNKPLTLGYTKNVFTEGSVEIVWDKRGGDLQEKEGFVPLQELIHDGHLLAAIALLGLTIIPKKRLRELFTNLREEREDGRIPETEIGWLSQIEEIINFSPKWTIKINSKNQFENAKEEKTGVEIRWGWHGVANPNGDIRFRAPDVVLPGDKKIARVPVLVKGEDGKIYVGVNPRGRILDFSELPEQVRKKYESEIGWGSWFFPNSQRIVGKVEGGLIILDKDNIPPDLIKNLKLVELSEYPRKSSPENPADFVGLAAIASALLGVRANATRFEELLATAYLEY